MTGWRELKKLPREMWLLNAANTINRMGTMAFLFLGLYLTKALGYPARVAGALLALFGLTALLATPLGGWLCDRWGPRRILVGSLALGGVLLIVFPVFHSLPAIFVMTAVVAVASEVFNPAILTYSTAALDPELKKTSIAMSRLSHNLGISVGPALGGWLAAISFRWVFWIDGATSLAAALILTGFLPDRRALSESAPPSFVTSLRQIARDRVLGYFLLAGVPLGIAWYQFGTVLPIYLVKSLGMKEVQYGFLFTINTVMVVLLEIPLTARTNHWSPARAMVLASLLFAIGFAALAFSKSYSGAIAMIVISTFGEMLIAPSSAAYISTISPRGLEGSYMGSFSASYCFCSFLAPLFGSLLLDEYGGEALWSCSLLLAALSPALLWRVRTVEGEPTPARPSINCTERGSERLARSSID